MEAVNPDRYLSVLMIVFWHAYWKIAETRAHLAKPPVKPPSIGSYLARLAIGLPMTLVVIQLLTAQPLLPFADHPIIGYTGFLAVVVGILLSLWARITLSSNWSPASEYQIKPNHELMTDGPYRYIRHPIYTALILVLTGAEIQVGSWLAIPMFLYMTGWAYRAAQREEKILVSHFADRYRTYREKTRMLIPGLL